MGVKKVKVPVDHFLLCIGVYDSKELSNRKMSKENVFAGMFCASA